jgi:uncharacterized protein (TIGR02453 family)
VPGFPPETLSLLADLTADPTPAAFDANRERYHAHWVGAARDVVEALAPHLAALSPALRAEPRVHGSILHPRQDVRLGRDRPPYRDHIGLLFWEGDRATAPSVLFLRLHADRLVLGAGARRLDPPRLRAYRTAVVDPARGGALVDAVAAIESAGWAVRGETLARGPRDVTSDDPDRARLLRHTALWGEQDLPHPGVLGSARLAAWCARRWAQLLPLHRWLTDELDGR